MHRFYRLDRDEQGQDVLNVVETCAIQGDHIPSVPEKYHNVLFYLGVGSDDRMFVRSEYCPDIPEDVIRDVEAWVNDAPVKMALPTYHYGYIMLNESERIPHLHLVYFAESEEAVQAFLNS
jgi:hypothetical protein